MTPEGQMTAKLNDSDPREQITAKLNDNKNKSINQKKRKCQKTKH